jgi:anti-sigma B factor antagonist
VQIRGDSLCGVPVLAITGDVDHATAPALDQAVRDVLQTDDLRLIVDLTSCRYIDSGGLAVFLYLVRRIRSQGWLGVIGADPNLYRLFEIVGLTQEPGFRVFAGADDVVALLGGPHT